MKNIIIMLLGMLLSCKVMAWDTLPNDSNVNKSTLKMGIGVFSGFSSYSTNTTGFSTTKNNSGLDAGASIKTMIRFKRKYTISLEFRYTKKNMFVEYHHPVFTSKVFFSQSFFQIPLYFSYSFINKKTNKERFLLSIGGAIGKSNNEFIFGQGAAFSATQFYENIPYSKSKSWHQSMLFAMSKTFKVGKKSYLTLFNEHEIQIDKGVRIDNVVDGGSNPSTFTVNNYPIYFKFYTPRIGVHYTF